MNFLAAVIVQYFSPLIGVAKIVAQSVSRLASGKKIPKD